MNKFILTENFCGKQKGEIIELREGTCSLFTSWKYRGSDITVYDNTDVLRAYKPTFEILALKHISVDRIFDDRRSKDQYWCTESDTWLSSEQLSGTVTIYRVKRLCDNEVFTVGDSTDIGVVTGFLQDGERIFLLSASRQPCYLDAYGGLPKKLAKQITFGDKLVDFRRHNDPNVQEVILTCGGHVSYYSKCKLFKEALDTVYNFKFDSAAIVSTRKIKVGCTTGTFDEICAIIAECERILKL